MPKTLTRRFFIGQCLMATAAVSFAPINALAESIDFSALSKREWKKRLTPEQFHILREEGTEAPYSHPLTKEKRPGTYLCAGCDLPLFTSDMKYDSGTGWPSFYDAIEGSFKTKTDYKIIVPRTEYHCARCEGHHGHIFKDGPKPTGLRYCNNGTALKFMPEGA